MKNLLPLMMAATLPMALSCQKMNSEPVGRPSEPPHNAAMANVVEAKENMGCLVTQRFVENVLPEVVRGVMLESGEAVEDRASQRELHIGFNPDPTLGLDGMLVFRIWVEPKAGGEKATLNLRNPHLEWGKGAWTLTMRASGAGTLRLQPFWTASSELEAIWRTCPDADIYEPFQGTFLAGGPLDAPILPDDRFELTSEPRSIEVRMDQASVAKALDVARCVSMLGQLAKSFGTAESRWLWDARKATAQGLMNALVKSERPGKAVSVKIMPDRGQAIVFGKSDFDPQLRFRLALLDEAGRRKGAEVWIAVTE